MNESELKNDTQTRRDRPGERRSRTTISDDMLIILPVRNLVLFPGTVRAGRDQSRALAGRRAGSRARRAQGRLPVAARSGHCSRRPGDDLHQVGTVASIVRYVTGQDGTHHLVVQGERRFRVLDFQNGLPFMVARVEYLPRRRTTPAKSRRAR